MNILLTALTASALDFGDPAPPVAAAEWLQGAPTATAGKVVVVEFWATWCGPCRQTVPHLTALQADHPDELVVIGVAADPAESPAALRQFIAQTDMGYRAITDDGGQTYAGYMAAMGIDALPSAFLIDRSGRLVWQGHPTALGEPVAEALASAPPVEVHAEVPLTEAPAPAASEDPSLLTRFLQWWAGLRG